MGDELSITNRPFGVLQLPDKIPCFLHIVRYRSSLPQLVVSCPCLTVRCHRAKTGKEESREFLPCARLSSSLQVFQLAGPHLERLVSQKVQSCGSHFSFTDFVPCQVAFEFLQELLDFQVLVRSTPSSRGRRLQSTLVCARNKHLRVSSTRHCSTCSHSRCCAAESQLDINPKPYSLCIALWTLSPTLPGPAQQWFRGA